MVRTEQNDPKCCAFGGKNGRHKCWVEIVSSTVAAGIWELGADGLFNLQCLVGFRCVLSSQL